jgi:hypothetical protein
MRAATRYTCSYVCNSRVSAASFEIDQLIQPPGGSLPRGEKEKRKPLCEGGHGPQLLLSISLIFCFFCRFFGLRRSGKASVNRVTRTRPADAMRKTPRKLHAAPFWRRVRADMSDVRVRGRTEIPLAASLPVRQTPPLGFFTRFPLSLSCRAKRCKSPMSEEARRGNILQIGRAENMTSPWSNHFLFFLRVENFSPKNIFFVVMHRP